MLSSIKIHLKFVIICDGRPIVKAMLLSSRWWWCTFNHCIHLTTHSFKSSKPSLSTKTELELVCLLIITARELYKLSLVRISKKIFCWPQHDYQQAWRSHKHKHRASGGCTGAFQSYTYLYFYMIQSIIYLLISYVFTQESHPNWK